MKKEIPRLKEVFKDDFKIGAAVNKWTLHSAKDLVTTQFNSITAENEMKPEMLQPEEGEFDFDYSDQLVSFANEHNLGVRGHTLVWHNQCPNWMFKNESGQTVDRERLLKRMDQHIETVVSRYVNQVYSWDVVNEVIADEEDRFLRQSQWLELAGEEFIERAFHTANKADPNATLFYNDYNESDPIKRDKIYKLVKSLLEKKVPIHGVGMQAHWNIHTPSIEHIQQAIELYASLGLEVQITEMDLSVFSWEDKRTDLLAPTKEMLALQERRYEQMFNLFREYRDVISSVTFWGGADDYTWLSNFPVKGRKNWPFLFDEYFNPKQSFWKVVQKSEG
ncbi:endo-1,4-beta-xylanase [Halalkalibacter sp. APA_J-10(15)]|uniref:endo-1,4-beta-xylanase n=1 Tax=Halalkalibacter sp. APA_J-10(15) TaxID=2933805 RepID=UPI001FF257F5|nr:endo-1,4-beta-xylanase [Halalkalibacter sp. APA_J-10(15)]MCK0473142.1 endo-1,4-beta-xylanase [Halalkalibacter sp. APA_J-10(15)]